MSNDEIKQIREYVFEKYIEGTHSGAEIDEAAALAQLAAHHRATPIATDGDTYYLGILWFELAFSDPKNEKLYMARALTLLEEWRARSGETGWEPIDDRIDDADGALHDLPDAEREKLLAAARAEMAQSAAASKASAAAAVVEEKAAGPVIQDGMVLVPGGTFLSGPAKAPRETKAFWIDLNPVTNADYRRFVEATGYRAPKFWPEGRFRQPEAPVVGVSWYDAFKYAAWAGKSLPTKDQWEKAARGRAGRIYPWGDAFEPALAVCGKADTDQSDGTEAVGQRPAGASEFGVLDMAGQVWEWTDSPDPSDPEQKVICGGSWVDDAAFLRCDEHLAAYPKDKYDNIGFRCVRLAKE